ncbi:MAG: hypothetical protein M0R31_05755 [Candidatus Riflebacteria bacterium]|nr:hypothetical protein [Candidatus Riflebacteria bacterium]
MKEETLKKRKRDVAHLWADKRVVRFFRKNFDKVDYKNLRSIYLALCEIDSDFNEDAEICGFAKTVATYAGMNEGTVRPYLRALQKAGIIDFEQQNIDGRFGGTTLSLYAWDESEENWMQGKIKAVIQSKMKRTRMPGEIQKNRLAENPYTGKPVYGKTGRFKNNTKVLSINKNSKEERDISLSPRNKPSIQERNKTFIPFANKLADIVRSSKNIKISQTKINSWTNEIRKLSETDGVTPARIETALSWYEDNAYGEYIPVIESGSSLREKFTRLEDAMKRAGAARSQNKPFKPFENEHKPSPQKLIKRRFSNDVLRKAFISNCYKPAKNLLRLNGRAKDASALAEALINLHDQINKEQRKNLTGELRRILPDGPMDLMEKYITWVEEQHWIDPHIKMFDVQDGRFAKFRRDHAKEDNQERDPLTGKSYIRG